MQPIETRSDVRLKVIRANPTEVFAAMSDPARVARWWGPAGFTNTIHRFDFVPGGRWELTMHGPDGTHYPNENRFTRIIANQLFEIEHFDGHHFVLTLELRQHVEGTEVRWRQTFDTVEHYTPLAVFVASANEQNLERLAAEVARGAGHAAATTYRGSCHCGAVRFEIETEQPLGPYFRCNCSLCSRKGAVMGAAPRDTLRLAAGEDLIATYSWNSLEAQHYFCKVCGIYTHHIMRGETTTVGVNMACIEGFDVFALGEVEVGDGKGGWSVVPSGE